MRLQIALDLVTQNEALAILDEICDLIDIVEVGTPWIVKEGILPVKTIRSAFPDIVLLADTKIMDAGKEEAQIALDAGADIVTVLGIADDATILAATAETHQRGKEILADMISVPNLECRASEIDRFGVDYICVHTGFDALTSRRTPIQELKIAQRVVSRDIVAAAGGINRTTVANVAAEHPAVIIVGGGITSQRNKRDAAKEIRRIIREME